MGDLTALQFITVLGSATRHGPKPADNPKPSYSVIVSSLTIMTLISQQLTLLVVRLRYLITSSSLVSYLTKPHHGWSHRLCLQVSSPSHPCFTPHSLLHHSTHGCDSHHSTAGFTSRLRELCSLRGIIQKKTFQHFRNFKISWRVSYL